MSAARAKTANAFCRPLLAAQNVASTRAPELATETIGDRRRAATRVGSGASSGDNYQRKRSLHARKSHYSGNLTEVAGLADATMIEAHEVSLFGHQVTNE